MRSSTHPRPEVALLLPSLAGGGAERTAVQLVNALAERGISTQLVLGRAEGPFLADISDEVEVVDLQTRRFRYALVPLIQYIRRTRPQCVLSFLTQANILLLVATRLLRRPPRTVVSERQTLSASIQAGDVGWARFLPPLMRRLYPHADGIIAVSRGVAADLTAVLALEHDMVTVINNPVPIESIQSQAAKPVEHEWFGDGEPPVVVGIGRLVPGKDFPTMIRAMAIVNKTMSARLLIIGQGPERDALKRLARLKGIGDCIDYLGFVHNPYPYIRQAAVVASTSRAEGFPNVLAEALALGRAIVATDCASGPAEILKAGEYGRLVPVGDHEAVAKALCDTLSVPPEEDRLIEWAKQWESGRIVDQYVNVLRCGDKDRRDQ